MNSSVISRLRNCPTVSDGDFKSDDRLFQVDEPATAKLLGPKLTVLVLEMTRSPWRAERRFRRDEAASSGTVVDDRYGGANWSHGGLKMREWKMRYGQKCKGGKCRSGKCGSR